MSNLRRSRPDEHDASLKRFQEISWIHHRRNSSGQSSPSSPHRMQYFKDANSNNACPCHDENSSPQQIREADSRWEKLRSILMTMKDEPFDVEGSMKTSPELLMNHQGKGKLSSEEELQLELSALQGVLEKKKLQLQQAEEQRDSALAYIRHLKVNSRDKLSSPDSSNEIIKFYEQGIESLRDSTVSKENVLAVLSPLMKELHRQKSYLDRLISITLIRSPWILDEVDKLEVQNGERPFIKMDDSDEGKR